MPNMIRALVAAGFASLIACRQDYIGQGPITLSPELRAYYDEYRAKMNPGAFAISKDGEAAAYSYCPEFGGCRGSEISGALASCRRRAFSPCYIYDIDGRVVWRTG